MFHSPEEWEELEQAAAVKRADAMEWLPAIGATLFLVALLAFYGYWPQLFTHLEHLFP